MNLAVARRRSSRLSAEETLSELAAGGTLSPAAATAGVAERLGLGREVLEYRRPMPRWSAQGLPVLQHRVRSVFQGLYGVGLVRRPAPGKWAIARRGAEIMSLRNSLSLGQTGASATFPPVLDACCGGRMFWFDRVDRRAVFVDKRRLSIEVPDASSQSGKRVVSVQPDLCADFTALPFPDESFSVVVFDPPHLTRNGPRSWLGLKYGTLRGDWRTELRHGFVECFRVLKPLGALVFKWNEHEIAVSEILALTPEKPLFGNRCGKAAKTHWIVFLKTDDSRLGGQAPSVAKPRVDATRLVDDV